MTSKMKRFGLSLAAIAVFGMSLAAGVSPAAARCKPGCTCDCHTRIVSGTCKTVFGLKVPCPLRQNVCEIQYCTQVSY